MEKGKCWWERFSKDYQAADYPVILADRDRKIVWHNEAANSLPFGTTIGMDLIFLPCISTVFDQFLQSADFRLAVGGILDGQYDCLLSPLPKPGPALGYALQFFPCHSFALSCPPGQIQREIDTLTHQARNPLSTIFSALMNISHSNNEIGDPDIHNYVNKISTQCYRLLRSATNLTEWQRYANGLSVYQPQRQNLCLFLEQLCRVISVMIERSGLQFQYSVPGEPVNATFDPNKLSTAVLNLISNAAKFSAESGRILVNLSINQKFAAISVVDNGFGIQAEALEHAFEPFYSYDPRTASICGDGVGLPLCKEIARELGGTVALGTSEGQGTRAMLCIPLCPDGGPILSVNDSADQYVYDRFSNMFVILSDVCKVPDF